MTTKELLEIVLLIVGGGGAAFTGGFWFSSLRAELRMSEIELKIADLILHTKTDGQKFAQKVTQNINHNMVEIGLIKADIKDIKRVLEMRRGQSFPDENKPPHTDFT